MKDLYNEINEICNRVGRAITNSADVQRHIQGECCFATEDEGAIYVLKQNQTMLLEALKILNTLYEDFEQHYEV